MIFLEEESVKQRETQLKKLLTVLSDGEWHSTNELVEKVGHRFSVSIQAAREQEQDIRRVREGRQNLYRWFHQ